MRSFTPSQMAKHFDMVALEASTMFVVVAEESAHIGLEETLHVYGDLSKLQTLADTTQTIREREGYSPNDPLLRSGELADSEYVSVGIHNPVYAEAAYGTDDERMLWLEAGTLGSGGYIPARPVNAIGAVDSLPEVIEVCRIAANFLVTGDKMALAVLRAKRGARL